MALSSSSNEEAWKSFQAKPLRPDGRFYADYSEWMIHPLRKAKGEETLCLDDAILLSWYPDKSIEPETMPSGATWEKGQALIWKDGKGATYEAGDGKDGKGGCHDIFLVEGAAPQTESAGWPGAREGLLPRGPGMNSIPGVIQYFQVMRLSATWLIEPSNVLLSLKDHDKKITPQATTIAFLEKHKTKLGIEIAKVDFHHENEKWDFIARKLPPGRKLFEIWPKLNEDQKNRCMDRVVEIHKNLASFTSPYEKGICGIDGGSIHETTIGLNRGGAAIHDPHELLEIVETIGIDKSSPLKLMHPQMDPQTIWVNEKGEPTGIEDWYYCGYYPAEWLNTSGLYGYRMIGPPCSCARALCYWCNFADWNVGMEKRLVAAGFVNKGEEKMEAVRSIVEEKGPWQSRPGRYLKLEDSWMGWM